jgi:hypothetical protein
VKPGSLSGTVKAESLRYETIIPIVISNWNIETSVPLDFVGEISAI